jgi:hypothetical protein
MIWRLIEVCLTALLIVVLLACLACIVTGYAPAAMPLGMAAMVIWACIWAIENYVRHSDGQEGS